MIIIKFAMIAFLVAVTLIFAMHPGQGVPVGGPFFYLAMPGVRNPIKPSLRMNAWQAHQRRNVWKVWFDGRGNPIKMRFYHDQVPAYEETLIWRKAGELVVRKRTL